jgi:hypothetical protein
MANQRLYMGVEDGAWQASRKRKSKGSVQTPDLNFPAVGSDAIIPLGLVNSRVNKLDGSTESTGIVWRRLSRDKREEVTLRMQDWRRLRVVAPTGNNENAMSVQQGFWAPKAVLEVRSLCELHHPWVVSLLETRVFSDRVDGLVRSLGMEGGFRLVSYGQSEGLALLWSQDVMVQLESYDKLHIDVTVRLTHLHSQESGGL